MATPPAAPPPPTIFSPRRRLAASQRALRLQRADGAARFLMDDMTDDVAERLAFLRHRPNRALLVGDWTGVLAANLRSDGVDVFEAGPALNEELPYPFGEFDLIASLGTLDTVNDLPGALIHIRRALAVGGLAIASFPGSGSLPVLRRVMLAADGERPAGRLHPLVDVRGGGELLQRAGWADPVVDSRTIQVSYRSLTQLVADVRAQGLGNVLASPGPAITRQGFARANEAFAEAVDDRGRVVETFEIVTLSGWRR